ncbi:DNA ligase [Salmonella phage 41]|nr:DNA ligase [Salmonella phage 41]
MEQGFEGSIMRNFKGIYEFGQRSSDLQNCWKLLQDLRKAWLNGSAYDITAS